MGSVVGLMLASSSLWLSCSLEPPVRTEVPLGGATWALSVLGSKPPRMACGHLGLLLQESPKRTSLPAWSGLVGPVVAGGRELANPGRSKRWLDATEN